MNNNRTINMLGLVNKFRHQYSTVKGNNYADIIISGGGMVGIAMACALAKLKTLDGKKIMLLESLPKAKDQKWKEKPYENRVSAITPGSTAFLKGIGVWDKVKERRCNPFNEMQVWESCGHGSITFNSNDLGLPNIAHIVENNVVIESCIQQVEECKEVEMKYNTKLVDINFPESKTSEGLISVETNHGEEFNTRLLIGADGFNSFVRSRAHIDTLNYDYNQSAVVATMKIQNIAKVPNKTAFQRYLSTGPIALLPLSDEWSSLVWSTTKTQAKELVKLSEDDFVAQVNNAFNKSCKSVLPVDALSAFMKNVMSTVQPGKFAGNVLKQPPIVTSVLSDSRGMFPLGMKHANYYAKSRVALIGDSAHRMHPMAGQGVNLGFGDAKSLTEAIDKSIQNGQDFGVLDSLLPYETERQRHVVSIIGAINGLNTLFSTEAFPIVFARTIGLTMTDSMHIVKEKIIQHAMS